MYNGAMDWTDQGIVLSARRHCESSVILTVLTETHGRDATRRHVIVYTLLLVPVALGLGLTSIGGPFYMAVAVVMNAWFLKGAYDIWQRDDAACEADKHAVEIKVFKVSLYYLFAHLGALLVEAALRLYGLGGWSW